MSVEFEDVEKTIQQIKRIYERSQDSDQCIRILETKTREEINVIFDYLILFFFLSSFAPVPARLRPLRARTDWSAVIFIARVRTEPVLRTAV